MQTDGIHLQIITPTLVALQQTVVKIIAETANGSFCLLPRHVDLVATLVPGILYCTDDEGLETYHAIGHGTLLKYGNQVRVATLMAVRGDNLAALQNTISERFLLEHEQAAAARTSLARLEAGTLRRFIDVENSPEEHATRGRMT